MTTIIVGDFDSKEILEKVEKEFEFKDRQNSPQKIMKLIIL